MRIVTAIAVGILFIVIGGRETIGSFKGIINGPAAAMVCFLTAATTLMQVKWSQILQSYFNGLKNENQSQPVYQTVGRNFLFAGLFGALLGCLKFANVAPNPDLIGPAIAFSYTSLAYGAAGYLFFSLCFQAVNERAEEQTKERDSQADWKNLFLKLFAFVIILTASVFLSKVNSLESLGSSVFLVFVAPPVALKIASGNKKNHQTDRFQQAAIIGGLLIFIFGLMHALANLSQKEKVYSALYSGALAVTLTFSTLQFLTYHSPKNGALSIRDERFNELRVVWKYFLSGLVISSIELGAVIYVLMDLR